MFSNLRILLNRVDRGYLKPLLPKADVVSEWLVTLINLSEAMV